MFRDPEPFGRQINHLPSLRQVCWVAAQIVVALFAADDGMNEHLVGRLHLPRVMPTMALLPVRRLPALFVQALGRTHKTIGGGRQTASMAIFGLCQNRLSYAPALTQPQRIADGYVQFSRVTTKNFAIQWMTVSV